MHAVLLSLLTLATPRLALVGFDKGAGVDDSSFRSVVDSIAGEVRQRTQAQLITPDEIKTLLSTEEQKQLMGCSAESCYAEIGGALGAERILTGSIAKTGQSFVLFIKVVHTKRIGEVKQVSRRFKGGSIDDVLDAIPDAVKELFGPAATPPPDAPPPSPPPGFDREGWTRNKPHADAQNIRQRVRVFADGVGHYLAVEPKSGSAALVFHGNIAGLYRQRLEGASRNGTKLSYTFVDPRYPDGWQRQIEVDGDTASVTCDQKTIPYKPLTAKETSVVLKNPLFDALVTYTGVALATDPDGVYYYVDRDTRAAQASGYRLFIGKKGKLALLTVDDVVEGEEATSYLTPQGRFTVGKKSAEWASGDRKAALAPANLYVKAPMVFRELGVYPQALGTPCDDEQPYLTHP
jgi:hypothetical protein